MNQQLAAGSALALLAALLQGTFLLPLGAARHWRWEHGWAAFSLFAMLLFNWAIAALFLPPLLPVYRSAPPSELALVVLFGTAWGIGAVLFGMGVDKLGLALGYPIIMGLNASLGALIPLVALRQPDVSAAKAAALAAGTVVALLGIVVCSVAGARKAPAAEARREPAADPRGAGTTAFAQGLVICVASGVLSGLPNVGMALSVNIVDAARAAGASPALAGNAVWALFFTLGAVVNVGYCSWLMVRRHSAAGMFCPDWRRNALLAALTALMWIASFYLYGMSAPLLGSSGAVIGWPIFISAAIGIGSLAGLWRGEWRSAPAAALRLLHTGLLLILAAVLILAAANRL